MNPSQYLDECKKTLEISSDYELAKKLEVHNGHIADFRNGKRAIPSHVALRIAITLAIDPARVWFDLEEQREKNPSRKELYRSFLSRASKLAALIACTLALILCAGVGADRGALGGFNRRRCCA